MNDIRRKLSIAFTLIAFLAGCASSAPKGVTIGGYGLALTPGEMAKLGFLFLNQGR